MAIAIDSYTCHQKHEEFHVLPLTTLKTWNLCSAHINFKSLNSKNVLGFAPLVHRKCNQAALKTLEMLTHHLLAFVAMRQTDTIYRMGRVSLPGKPSSSSLSSSISFLESSTCREAGNNVFLTSLGFTAHGSYLSIQLLIGNIIFNYRNCYSESAQP